MLDLVTPFAVKRGAQWTTEQLWENAELPLRYTTPVVSGDMLFGFSGRNAGQYYAMDARSGKTLWTSDGRQATHASVARAGDLLGAPPTHVDVHRHLHRYPAVLEALCRLAGPRGLPVRALDDGMRAELHRAGVRTTDHFVGEASGEAYWTELRFAGTVAALADGVTELMCHPGYPPRETRTSYALQRAVELATLTSAAARQAILDAGVTLGSFAELG